MISNPASRDQDLPSPMTDANCDFADRLKIDGRNGRLSSWFDLWRGSMCRWVSSRSSLQPADLDDVAQEVFLRLLRYSDDAVVTNPQSYLFRVASNVVNEWRERSRNCMPHDSEGLEDLLIETHDEPENSVERTLLDEHVRMAVERLPERQRNVLLLHVKEELTYKQIAARLKLSPRVVRRDIARTYSRLRSELRDAYLGETAAQEESEDSVV